MQERQHPSTLAVKRDERPDAGRASGGSASLHPWDVCVCPGDWCVPGCGHVIATRDLGTPRDTVLHAAAGVYVGIMLMGSAAEM